MSAHSRWMRAAGWRWLRRVVGGFLLLLPAVAGAAEFEAARATAGLEARRDALNLWPFYDRRYDPVDRAYTTGGLGPFVFSARAADASVEQVAVRPLFHVRRETQMQREEIEGLYPVVQYTRSEQDWEFQFGYLLNFRREGSSEAEREEHHDFFPFYLSGRRETGETYRWFFPFYGTVYDRLGRDEIQIMLFPLYMRTQYRGWESHFAPWPIVKFMGGADGRTGFHLWPLYGEEAIPGKYEWGTLLWPFFMRQRKDLDTDNPEDSVVVFPFVMAIRSPARETTTYLWPLFTYRVDREAKFEEWQFPWPIFIIARGETRHVTRFLPLFTVERYLLRDLPIVREMQVTNIAVLYPLYVRTVDETATSLAVRDRILWWLYSDLRETGKDGNARRVDAWPLFRYVRDREGWVTFQTLALLEAIMPGNELFERNWSPLWALYTYRRNPQGDRVHSFLWNLVRYEESQEEWALEVLGPVLAYRVRGEERRLALLAGLLSFERAHGVQRVRLLGEAILTWRVEPRQVAVLETAGGGR